MQNELKVLEAHLTSIKSESLVYLNPPIKDNELPTFIFKNYGEIFEIGNLKELYEWHNGPSLSNLPDNHRLTYISEELAIMNIDDIGKLINPQTDTFYQFIEKKLFPFAQSYNGEYFAFNLKNSKIFYCSTFDFEIDNIVSIFDDLKSMFETINRWFEYKCLKLNEYREVELDLKMYNTYLEIGLKINTYADYWKIKKEIEDNL